MARRRRSPRCSWCYKEGHTKNHCPEIKKAAAEGDAWAIRQVERQKKSVSNRQCSYCGETGHNKRGCSKLKADKALWEQVVQTFHKERQEVMLEKRGEVAAEFDAIHSVDRAVKVGSLDAAIDACDLRPRIISELEAMLVNAISQTS